jgi:hypothetical protein
LGFGCHDAFWGTLWFTPCTDWLLVVCFDIASKYLGGFIGAHNEFSFLLAIGLFYFTLSLL